MLLGHGQLGTESGMTYLVTISNYTPTTLPAGVATDICALATTHGNTVIVSRSTDIKYFLQYALWCPTGSTAFALVLKLGATTLYSGTITSANWWRNLAFTTDIANNKIYMMRSAISDSSAASLGSAITFSDWNVPQQLSLTVQPTAESTLMFFEAGLVK